MTRFDKSLNELQEFFKKNGSEAPFSMVSKIIVALNAALNLVPDLSKEDATIILRSTDAFGVQQFVTQFGCHLEYHHQVDKVYNDYTVVPNWK